MFHAFILYFQSDLSDLLLKVHNLSIFLGRDFLPLALTLFLCFQPLFELARLKLESFDFQLQLTGILVLTTLDDIVFELLKRLFVEVQLLDLDCLLLYLMLELVGLVDLSVSCCCNLIALLLENVDQILLELHLGIINQGCLCEIEVWRWMINRRQYRVSLILWVSELRQCWRRQVSWDHLLTRCEQSLSLREISMRRVVGKHRRGHVELLCGLVDVLQQTALICRLGVLVAVWIHVSKRASKCDCIL